MVWGWSGCGGEWMGRAPCYWGVYFLYIFSGFAIDRSKKYIKGMIIFYVLKGSCFFQVLRPAATGGGPSGRLAAVGGRGYFLYIFSGFAIDRSKKNIKTIKNCKIDAVDPQAAADN